jgi:hypothetical protein
LYVNLRTLAFSINFITDLCPFYQNKPKKRMTTGIKRKCVDKSYLAEFWLCEGIYMIENRKCMNKSYVLYCNVLSRSISLSASADWVCNCMHGSTVWSTPYLYMDGFNYLFILKKFGSYSWLKRIYQSVLVLSTQTEEMHDHKNQQKVREQIVSILAQNFYYGKEYICRKCMNKSYV